MPQTKHTLARKNEWASIKEKAEMDKVKRQQREGLIEYWTVQYSEWKNNTEKEKKREIEQEAARMAEKAEMRQMLDKEANKEEERKDDWEFELYCQWANRTICELEKYKRRYGSSAQERREKKDRYREWMSEFKEMEKDGLGIDDFKELKRKQQTDHLDAMSDGSVEKDDLASGRPVRAKTAAHSFEQSYVYQLS